MNSYYDLETLFEASLEGGSSLKGLSGRLPERI